MWQWSTGTAGQSKRGPIYWSSKSLDIIFPHRKHAWSGSHALFTACRIFQGLLVSINFVWNQATLPLPLHFNICSESVFPRVETALLHCGCRPQKGSRRSRFPSGTNFLMLQSPRAWLPPQETLQEWQTISSLVHSQPSFWLRAAACSPKRRLLCWQLTN